MTQELNEDDVVIYGYIRIMATVDGDLHEIIKIQTDKGYMIVRPKSGNSITIESDS